MACNAGVSYSTEWCNDGIDAAVEKLSRLNSKILHISQISSRDNENNFEDSQEKTLSRNYYKPMQWS